MTRIYERKAQGELQRMKKALAAFRVAEVQSDSRFIIFSETKGMVCEIASKEESTPAMIRAIRGGVRDAAIYRKSSGGWRIF